MTGVVPYGAWPSPISARALVDGLIEPTAVVVDGDDIWWSEERPAEGGRTVLVRWRDGSATPLDGPADVRTMVHEYGEGAWWVARETVIWSEKADHRLRRLGPADDAPMLLTPDSGGLDRFADGRITPDGRWYVCVRERHPAPDAGAAPGPGADAGVPIAVANDLVAVALDGSMAVDVLVSGPDFVSAPRISPDGLRLAWIQWDHPNLPWDDTELWVADLRDGRVSGSRCVAGQTGGEALTQPDWAPDGRLMVVSDRSDWWGLYAVGADGLEPVRVVPGEEMAEPDWVFGLCRHAVLPGGELVVAPVTTGGDRLLVASGTDDDVLLDGEAYITNPRPHGDGVVALVAAAHHTPAIIRVDRATKRSSWIRPPHDHGLDPALTGRPEAITFPTTGGAVAHALYHRPANPAVAAPAGERPPLLVMAHGGPTSAARGQLQLSQRFWTSRGFALVDVDYRGSTGYGRAYRRSLYGRWGVADVDDCLAAVGYLVERGDVDPDRVAIRGGSAGGFTVLRALTLSSTFAAGVSRYGVADLETLATDTHKFESRYLDQLVGPYPERRDLYVERSPIHHVGDLSVPMLVLQGLDDAIVPPNQSEMIVAALAAKGVPVAYLAFEGEGHGFRKAESIVTSLETELAFYGAVFGFEPAGAVTPVPWSGVGPATHRRTP